jgi:hypothetical protein
MGGWYPAESGRFRVVSPANDRRRHLTPSQLSLVAAKLANIKQGASNEAAISQTDAAEALNVSRSNVQRGKAVLDSEDQDLISSVERGERPTSFQEKGFHPMFFRKPKPADKLTNAQLVSRLRGEIQDAVDNALENRQWDRALRYAVENELRDQSQRLAMQRSMS